MPTTFNPNVNDSGQDPELEDIFAGTESGMENSMESGMGSVMESGLLAPGPQHTAEPRPFSGEPVVSDTSDMSPLETPNQTVGEDTTPEIPMARQTGTSRRILIMIAIVIVALLLLGGIAWGIYWFMSRPVIEPSDVLFTNNSTVESTVEDPVIINTGTPLNLNTSSDTSVIVPQNPSAFTDTDHDGLSDEEELLHNTNPKKSDTDEDGLSDREEVRVYLTDPRNPDTDGDGYIDGDEVANFYHPNDPNPKKRLFDLEKQ